MAAGVYPYARQDFVTGALAWTAATPLKVLLVKDTFLYSPGHRYVSGIVTYEVAGANYGRKSLTGISTSVDTVADTVRLLAHPLTWPALNVGKIGGMVVFVQGSTDADSRLVGYTTDGFPRDSNGGDVTLAWDVTGLALLV